MRAILVGVFVVAAGCGEARPTSDGERTRCANWKDAVAAALAARCSGCHPAGSDYDVTTYLTAITDRAGQPVAEAGNAQSRILTVLADDTHVAAGVSDARALVSDWVITCALAYQRPGVHEPGVMNPADPGFHGNVARDVGWDLELCARCHGADFSGGSAGVGCTQCHGGPGGPRGCTTCHGEPPATAAHLAHAGGTLARPFDCSECHVKPTAYTDVGHIRDASGHVLAHAPVSFGALANATNAYTTRQGAAAWDRDADRCSNVYCHGDAFSDAAATNTRPHWNGGSGEAACGSCHGLPPSNHASHLRCNACHTGITDDANAIVDRARHADGHVDVGSGDGTGCLQCHGQPPATGAHLAHMSAQHRLAAPVGCGECHVVPATVDAPGHLDDVVELFPAGAGVLARTGGAMPAWDGARCSGVYCHGAATPAWSGGTAQAVCGSCHAIPPADPPHAPTMGLASCAACHPKTMDATGALVFVNGTSAHINGVIDAP